MAQRVSIVLEDDLDGGSADETVPFGLDGSTYEIDLSAKNATALRNALAKYIAAGRRSAARSRRSRGARRSTTPSEIRSWARDHGYTVSDRGRVGAEVVEAYRAAQK